MNPRMPLELSRICASWTKAVESFTADSDRIRFFQKNLPELLVNTSLFSAVLEKISNGEPYPDIRKAELFDDEILLFLHPKRKFSLRVFLFDPEEFTPIHDHNSWGVTGTEFTPLTIIIYKREDNDSKGDTVRIAETQRLTLIPGQTDVTLPLDQGIHATGNVNQTPMMMVSVYGSPIRRLYVNRFDPIKNRVFKMFAPRIRKKKKAENLLAFMKKRNDRMK